MKIIFYDNWTGRFIESIENGTPELYHEGVIVEIGPFKHPFKVAAAYHDTHLSEFIVYLEEVH